MQKNQNQLTPSGVNSTFSIIVPQKTAWRSLTPQEKADLSFAGLELQSLKRLADETSSELLRAKFRHCDLRSMPLAQRPFDVFAATEHEQVGESYKVRPFAAQWLDHRRPKSTVISSTGNFATQACNFYSSCGAGPVHIFLPRSIIFGAETPIESATDREANLANSRKRAVLLQFEQMGVAVLHTKDELNRPLGKYDDAATAAKRFAEREGLPYFHPFDSFGAIAGNYTLGSEIAQGIKRRDNLRNRHIHLFASAGGGGHSAGTFLGLVQELSGYGTTFTFWGAELTGQACCLARVGGATQPIAVSEATAAPATAVASMGVLPYAVHKTLGTGWISVPKGALRSSLLELAEMNLLDTGRWFVEPSAGEAHAAARVAVALGYVQPEDAIIIVLSGSNADPAYISTL